MKIIKKLLPYIITIMICTIISVAADYLYNSSNVYYDNTKSELDANDVNTAIDKLYASSNDYDTLDGRIETLETLIGDTSLTTTAQTLTGAVNELNGKTLKLVRYAPADYNFHPSTSYTTVGPIPLPPGLSVLLIPYANSQVTGVRIYTSTSNYLYINEAFSGSYQVPLLNTYTSNMNVYVQVKCANNVSNLYNYVQIYRMVYE